MPKAELVITHIKTSIRKRSTQVPTQSSTHRHLKGSFRLSRQHTTHEIKQKLRSPARGSDFALCRECPQRVRASCPNHDQHTHIALNSWMTRNLVRPFFFRGIVISRLIPKEQVKICRKTSPEVYATRGNDKAIFFSSSTTPIYKC